MCGKFSKQFYILQFFFNSNFSAISSTVIQVWNGPLFQKRISASDRIIQRTRSKIRSFKNGWAIQKSRSDRCERRKSCSSSQLSWTTNGDSSDSGHACYCSTYENSILQKLGSNSYSQGREYCSGWFFFCKEGNKTWTFSKFQAKDFALRHAKENHLKYINGYDAIDILAGQGTIGLEILDQVPDVDTILVPVGGGGLIAGIATAVKTLKPDVHIYVSSFLIIANFKVTVRTISILKWIFCFFFRELNQKPAHRSLKHMKLAI